MSALSTSGGGGASKGWAGSPIKVERELGLVTSWDSSVPILPLFKRKKEESCTWYVEDR